MKPGADPAEQQDQIIAGLLMYGTWFASALITIGVLLTAVEHTPLLLALPLSGYGTAKAGIAVFILLPIARVALMLTLFLRERDYVYTAIAALVLAIIAAGIFIEV